jgi:hypothetical protein
MTSLTHKYPGSLPLSRDPHRLSHQGTSHVVRPGLRTRPLAKSLHQAQLGLRDRAQGVGGLLSGGGGPAGEDGRPGAGAAEARYGQEAYGMVMMDGHNEDMSFFSIWDLVWYNDRTFV